MPVNATPVTTQVVTLDDVRGFLRDVAGQVPGTSAYNALFDLPEFSDADVNRAIKFVVSKFNVMTPPFSDSQDSIPAWLLLVGVSAFLCMSETFRQQRNPCRKGALLTRISRRRSPTRGIPTHTILLSSR